MIDIEKEISDLAHYDQCAHVPPLFFSQILSEIYKFAAPTELARIVNTTIPLPKVAGAFVYRGYPCHMRCVEHSGSMYIIFCTFHSGASGNTGSNFLLFIKDAEGQYIYRTQYTANTVVDWVARAFGEASATSSYSGTMSSLMYKRITAIYDWCVSKGMTPIT